MELTKLFALLIVYLLNISFCEWSLFTIAVDHGINKIVFLINCSLIECISFFEWSLFIIALDHGINKIVCRINCSLIECVSFFVQLLKVH